VEETANTLHALNPTAPILRTVRGQVDLTRVMRLGAYASGRREILDESAGHVHAPDCDHDHEHGDEQTKTHYTLNGISSLTLSGIPPLNPEQFQSLDAWLRSVLWDGVLPTNASTHSTATLEILRSKALLITTAGEAFVLQGVRNMYELEKSPESVGSHQTGKFVLIGRGLDEVVRSSLESIWLW
jgi:G3E family GTPase